MNNSILTQNSVRIFPDENVETKGYQKCITEVLFKEQQGKIHMFNCETFDSAALR